MPIITITEHRRYLRRGQPLVSTFSSHFSGGFTFARYFLADQRTLITTRDGVTRSGSTTDSRINCSDGYFDFRPIFTVGFALPEFIIPGGQ